MKQTIEHYAALLRVNKHGLDEELVSHSDSMFQICECLGEAQAVASDRADALRRMEADAYAVHKATGASDKNAEMAARGDPHRISAWASSEEAKTVVLRWQALLEAWKQKGHSMRELVALYQAQYFALDPAGHDRPVRTTATTTSREREPVRTRRSAA